MENESSYLDKIIADKRSELSALRPVNWDSREIEDQLSRLPVAADFPQALRGGLEMRTIAEFKRASPSEGPIRESADPAQVAEQYESAGAAAISVLTDSHFSGSMDDLRAVRAATDLPILCKDFIISREQIVEARMSGADAILLIVAALEAPTLRDLFLFARSVGVHVLCEAHTGHEIDRALAVGADVIGINNRDLKTFEVNIERSIFLRRDIPDQFVCVAESGIRCREDVQRLMEADIHAMLVGTQLMRAEHPGQALRELIQNPHS